MALRQNVSLQVGLLVLCLTWGVRAMLEVVMEDRVEVMRGDTAQITCMFTTTDGIGGLIIQWFYTTSTGVKHKIYSQDTMVNTVERGTQFTDRISVNSTLSEHGEVVLTISDVQLYDEQGFICHIRSLTDGDGEGRTQLRVFATPEYPTIEAVHTGIWLSSNYLSKIGSCQAKNGYPRANITWYRDSTPLLNVPNEVDVQTQVTRESSGLFSVKSELHLMVTEEDKNSQFYCEVDYFVAGGLGMLESKKINITVFFPTDVVTVWVESPKGDIKEGDTVELQCRGNGNPPSLDLTFKHGDAEMSKDSSDNTLVLKDVTRQNSGLYQCSTLNTETLEDIVGNTTVVVNYLDPAVVIPKHTHVMFQGEGLDATCNALSSLKTKTAWFKNGVEVAKGHILTLKDAAFDTAGTYVCAVTVPQMEGMETNATLRVAVQGPPVVSTPVNTLIEERVKKTVNLSCHARGFPVPTITWSPSDAEFKPVSSKETEDTVLSVVSLEVRSDITALCNASNQFGTKGVAFSIKAIAHTTSTATTAQTATAIPPEKVKNEGSGVIIAVIIICLLLLAILGSVLYFLYKKGKICGRSGKQDLTKEKSNKENIVVEMKSDNTEEAVLLGVNGEKKPPGDQ